MSKSSPLRLSFALLILIATLLASIHARSGVEANVRGDNTNNDLALSIGRTATWPVGGGKEISVSNGAVVRVVDQGAVIKITALKLGSAVIRSGEARLEVNVLPEASYRIYASLQEAIAGRRGLELSAASGALKLQGRLLRWDDWKTVATTLQYAKPGTYTFSALLESDVATRAEREIALRLREAGLAHVNLRLSPDAVATVSTEPKDAKDRAEKILSPYGIRVEANSSVLTLEPMIRVRILVAEVTKTFSRNLGIKWPSSITGQLLPNFSFDQGGAPFSINASEDSGDMKVLASPTLLCRSGKEAEFLAGGEFPIKLTSHKSSDVAWKKYGVLLKIKPMADFEGRMSIGIETEVSTLNPKQQADGLPSLLTNRMQTHFDLSKSRTIALSGLIKNSTAKDSAGLPGLKDLPILGPLFSSRGFDEERSELIIFVTPDVAREDNADSDLAGGL